MDLVIVESPSKAKTICKYLGSGYKVLASGGHVRDLPANKLGVNVHNNFEPEYEIYSQKQTTIRQLQKEVANADKVYLATDPDREGEAISWHLQSILNIKDTNVRIVFNEITKKAVNKAIENPHEINYNLVNSQQARRVLDRLVGYLISPIISKKIKKGLSAGRVQSVALRMVVDKEREIRAFIPEEYWNIFANVLKDGSNGVYKAAFNDINGKKTKVTNKDDADKIIEESKQGRWYVGKVKRAESLSKPNPPFTTSTLQQDGVNKLNMSSSQIMQIAQKLYEGVSVKGEGQIALVTYIRTDSVRISDDAQAMAKKFIVDNYGKEYYPSKPNAYHSKDNAQDAHEAIRPVNLDIKPEDLKGKVDTGAYRLYKLIYDRFVASQMTNARYDTLTVNIISEYEAKKYGYLLKGKTMTFPGYTVVYQSNATEEDITNALPSFDEKDAIKLKDITGEQKFTKPPVRYTDSSLVKAMEENGIGRPSTYASIISVLDKRLYIERESKYMKPTELGEIVSDQLVKYFPDIMDTTFTAAMELKLDTVADGEVDWHTIIKDFYPGFIKALNAANDGQKVKVGVIETDIACPKCGKIMVVREGKYGKFLGCSGFPDCNNIMPYETLSDNKTDKDDADFSTSAKDEPAMICDKCGKPMVKRHGKYGDFYGCSDYPNCKNIININTDSEDKDTSEPKTCPKCGKPMVIKTGKFGKFYSCTGYPECKSILPYNKVVGKCPKCGKDIVERMSKAHKVFYACVDNEDCKFFSYDLPAPHLCPKCSNTMKMEKDENGYKLTCINKQCAYTENVAKDVIDGKKS